MPQIPPFPLAERPLDLRLAGARVLLPSGIQRGQVLALRDGWIEGAARPGAAPLPLLELPGCLILPGMVDAFAARATPLALAAAGVTTALGLQGRRDQSGPALRRAGLVQGNDGGRVGRMLAAALRGSLDALLVQGGVLAAGLSAGQVTRLADAIEPLGLPFGSIGDPDAETRVLYAALGARIAVFPAGWRAASVARAEGHAVIAAAGDSRPGPFHADLVAQGHCTALASDGDPARLLPAVRALLRQGGMDPARAWGLVSEAPARILGLHDRGRIAPGLRADLLVLDPAGHIGAVLVAGRPVWLQGAVGARLQALIPPARLAAE